jgi:serine/threonine protein kinase, bacterial
MPLRIGETFAGYRILRLLGSGGMGEVYLVQHPRLPRRDALKVLRPDLSSDASFRERFIREADLAAGLRHPHIVGIHDRGEHDGQLWIAMDYIDGIDIAQLMQQRYPAGMPADLAISISAAVASALDYAHGRSLLHRDVKPANIIVADLDTEERHVFLADFGIARPLDDTSGITTTNMTVGTVAYAAPEQLMGERMDGRADQYALAATSYELLTGLQLFTHSNPAVVISRHLSTTPPALSDQRPDLAALDPVLATALAKDPNDRFQLCADFARALTEEVLAEVGTSKANATTRSAAAGPRQASRAASKSASPTPPSPRTTATLLGNWRLFATAILGVFALGVVLAWVWHPWNQSQSLQATQATPAPPAVSSTTQPSLKPSIAPPPVTPTSLAPQGSGYALTGCYDTQSPPADRPTTVSLLYCASGGLWLRDMSWSSWGPDGADGAGTATFQVCQPDCADGHEASVPVVVHAWSPLPSPGNSTCPRDREFFAEMILAFPQQEPPLETNTPALSRYNGMPAIRYTTYSNPGPPIQVMNPPFCA